jgi:hypothetical protein
MSSIFSDPFFRRGTTLLGGETIERDASNNPIAGTEIVGQVKVFQDAVPTGMGERRSNRLVYCVAARYKGSDVTDASTLAGEVFAFDATAPLTEFATSNAKATAANANSGLMLGVLDEYLTGSLRANDIVWLVVKGPTSIKQTAAAINAGVAVHVSGTAGSVSAAAGAGASTVAIGQQIAGSNSAAAVGLTRVNLMSDYV